MTIINYIKDADGVQTQIQLTATHDLNTKLFAAEHPRILSGLVDNVSEDELSNIDQPNNILCFDVKWSGYKVDSKEFDKEKIGYVIVLYDGICDVFNFKLAKCAQFFLLFLKEYLNSEDKTNAKNIIDIINSGEILGFDVRISSVPYIDSKPQEKLCDYCIASLAKEAAKKFSDCCYVFLAKDFKTFQEFIILSISNY